MIKKLAAAAAVCLMLAGCGVSQESYEQAVNERDALAAQVAELEAENDDLSSQNAALKAENESLKAEAATAAAAGKTTEASSDQTGQYTYIGNKNSYKFHRKSCSTLPAESNRVYYATREEAINDGMVPCKRCDP